MEATDQGSLGLSGGRGVEAWQVASQPLGAWAVGGHRPRHEGSWLCAARTLSGVSPQDITLPLCAW